MDTSKAALESANENAILNQVNDKISFINEDALEYIKKMQLQNKMFDLVICDPPKLAPTRASLDRARSKFVISILFILYYYIYLFFYEFFFVCMETLVIFQIIN